MIAERNMFAPNGRAAGHGDPAARRRSRLWVPVIALLVVLIGIGSSMISLSRPSIPDEIEGLILYENLESRAVDGPVDYDVIPPAGGPHAPTSLECGIYLVPVEDERAVAALATGAVWFAYDPGYGESLPEQLEIFVEGERDTFMTPYPGLPEPIIVTAWGVQLHPDSADDTRIASFLRDYKNADGAPYPDLPCHEGTPVG